MKFAINTIKEGIYCFLFTPALMLALWVSVVFFGVTADTELHPVIASFINWRFSADGFWLMLFVSLVVCSIITVIISYYNKIPSYEKNLLGKTFNIAGSFLSKVFLFWGGVSIAWIFASHFINFIQQMPNQVLGVPLFILLAVFVRYAAIKAKHRIIRR